jgi:hypothetical protein
MTLRHPRRPFTSLEISGWRLYSSHILHAQPSKSLQRNRARLGKQLFSWNVLQAVAISFREKILQLFQYLEFTITKQRLKDFFLWSEKLWNFRGHKRLKLALSCKVWNVWTHKLRLAVSCLVPNDSVLFFTQFTPPPHTETELCFSSCASSFTTRQRFHSTL